MTLAKSSVDRRKCCQLSSTNSGFGRFITLIVRLCLQHDTREVTRRTGPSTTALGMCIARSFIQKVPIEM